MPKKKNIGLCNYHLCKKKSVRLYNCFHCKEKFCNEHKNPKEPTIPDFKATDSRSLKRMEEYYKKGHPCFPYVGYLEKKTKEKENKYWAALDRISGRKAKKKTRTVNNSQQYKSSNVSSKKHTISEDIDDYRNKISRSIKKKNLFSIGNSIKILLILGIFVFILYPEEILSYMNYENFMPKDNALTNNNSNAISILAVEMPDYYKNFDIYQFEEDLLAEINSERISNNIPTLIHDEKLRIIARKHSVDMITYGFFSHVSSGGENLTQRAEEYDYKCKRPFAGGLREENIEENIAQNSFSKTVDINGTVKEFKTYDELKESIIQNWMNNPSNKNKILNETYNRVGTGVAIDKENHKITITQDFC